MIKYRPKKWLVLVRVFCLFGIVFLLGSSTLYYSDNIKVENSNLNKTVELETIEGIYEDLYVASLYEVEDSFVGQLTGYAGDCELCSGVLACKPRTNVLEKGILFEDKEYGQVRIVASSPDYPCGTILQFQVNKISSTPITAVVMDRGVGGNVIDLLTESEEYALKNVGRVKNLQFDILRYGWS